MVLYRCYMNKIITSFFIFLSMLAMPVYASITPNDSFFGNQWYLSKIKADSAWDKVSESPDTVIAVIDSGVQISHPDLRDNIWTNEREIPGDGLDNDKNGFIDDVNGWDFSVNIPDPSPKFNDGSLVGENMVIGVAATDALDQKTKFSSYGFSCVDISAPGISFFNTVTGDSRAGAVTYYDGYWSGTSMAAPLVSATLALIQQANPELSRRETVNILFASTDNISRLNPDYLGQLGNGRLNVNRAVEMAKEKLYNHLGRLLIIPDSQKNKLKVVAANGDLAYYLPDEIIKAGTPFTTGDINGNGIDEIV